MRSYSYPFRDDNGPDGAPHQNMFDRWHFDMGLNDTLTLYSNGYFFETFKHNAFSRLGFSEILLCSENETPDPATVPPSPQPGTSRSFFGRAPDDTQKEDSEKSDTEDEDEEIDETEEEEEEGKDDEKE